MNSKVVQTKTVQQSNPLDTVKFVLAVLLVAAGVFAFYWFDGKWSDWMRAAAVVSGLVLGAIMFMLSSRGPQLVEFFKETRFELRKVVWPTWPEALRMTWVVMGVVAVFSIILFGFDSAIGWTITKLLGA